MARNQEKAQAMLNRFITMKRDQARGPREKRPHLSSEVTNLSECEKWRQDVIRQISKQVSIIQNGGLGEHKIRDLNDQINKLFREKRAWERQIKFLGGVDYGSSGMRVLDEDGHQALGSEGYYYFGAAKDLPGVRELFEKNVASTPMRSRQDLSKCVNGDYYGYGDDDDGLLQRLEAEHEKKVVAETVKQHAEIIKQIKEQGEGDAEMTDGAAAESKQPSDETANESDDEDFTAHVRLPTQEEIEKQILLKKKEELLSKYGNAAASD